MRAHLTDESHAQVVMFMQGAAGDIKQGAQVGDQVGWIGDYDSVKALGVHLGQRVADALGDLQPIEGPLRAMSRTVAAP